MADTTCLNFDENFTYFWLLEWKLFDGQLLSCVRHHNGFVGVWKMRSHDCDDISRMPGVEEQCLEDSDLDLLLSIGIDIEMSIL